MKQPCAKIRALLDSWCAPGGVLDAGGVRASFRLYENDPGRRRIRAAIVDAYLAEQAGIDRDGRCAIVTAGVPVPESPPRSNPAGRPGLAGS